MNKYILGPFILESQIQIPELPEAGANQTPNVFIRLGSVPVRLEHAIAGESRWSASPDEYLLRIRDVGNFLVRGGSEVIVEPAANALLMDVRAYLLAPIFSTLCHQSGRYALHASSIQVNGGIIAFLGNSGAGKSTLVAYLDRRGYSVMSDDICLIEPDDNGGAHVIPVAPAIKLWRNALEHIGESSSDLPRVLSSEDKYRLPLNASQERLPLTHLLFLEWSDDSDERVSFTPLDSVNSIQRMMDLTHQEYLMKVMNRRKENFLLYGKILAGARAAILKRPKDFHSLSRVTDELETYLCID